MIRVGVQWALPTDRIGSRDPQTFENSINGQPARCTGLDLRRPKLRGSKCVHDIGAIGLSDISVCGYHVTYHDTISYCKTAFAKRRALIVSVFPRGLYDGLESFVIALPTSESSNSADIGLWYGTRSAGTQKGKVSLRMCRHRRSGGQYLAGSSRCCLSPRIA